MVLGERPVRLADTATGLVPTRGLGTRGGVAVVRAGAPLELTATDRGAVRVHRAVQRAAVLETALAALVAPSEGSPPG